MYFTAKCIQVVVSINKISKFRKFNVLHTKLFYFELNINTLNGLEYNTFKFLDKLLRCFLNTNFYVSKLRTVSCDCSTHKNYQLNSHNPVPGNPIISGSLHWLQFIIHIQMVDDWMVSEHQITLCTSTLFGQDVHIEFI